MKLVAEQAAPVVDGVPLPEGYGVLIEADGDIDVPLVGEQTTSRRPYRLWAWLTIRNAYGEYQRARLLHARAHVRMEFGDRVVEFDQWSGETKVMTVV